MDSEEFQQRTKNYGLRIVRLVQKLPNEPVADVIARQLLRAGTSVGANYRAAARAKSRRDFISKMAIVEEECDESLYWLELLIEAKILKAMRLMSLMSEGNQIVAMTVASIRTARKNGTLRIADCGLRIADCGMRNADFDWGSRIGDWRSQILRK